MAINKKNKINLIPITEDKLKEKFMEDMKLFKRFLKDNGAYPRIYEYILPKYSMTMDMFYIRCKGLYVDTRVYSIFDFRDILHIMGTIEISYKRLGHEHWEKNIKPFSDKFVAYYGEKNGEIKKYEIIEEDVLKTATINRGYVWDGSAFTTTTQG